MNAFVKLARLAEIAAMGVIVAAMAMVVKAWEILPDTLSAPLGPGGGRPVVIGSKEFLLWILLGIFAVYLLLSVFMRFHRLYGYPVKIRPYNREAQQALLKSYISLLKFELTCIGAYLIAVILFSTLLGRSLWFDMWFVLLVACVLGSTTGGYYLLAHKHK